MLSQAQSVSLSFLFPPEAVFNTVDLRAHPRPPHPACQVMFGLLWFIGLFWASSFSFSGLCGGTIGAAVRSERAGEWRSLSRTKRPPLHFIDVLMRLSRLPSELLHVVAALRADRCTRMLSPEKGFYSFLGLTVTTSLVAFVPPFFPSVPVTVTV